ncbi:MAG TPA: hypothetical protein VF007_05770 [Stellaceae bacterium]
MPKKTAPIPLWLAAHEAAHVVARIQLTAAWHGSGLERPGCMEEVRVWIEPDGTPRGNCEWGYADVISWPYQAISWAAGPIAEARVRESDPRECLLESPDYPMLAHYAQRGFADRDEAFHEGSRIVEKCWPDIEKLAAQLQQNRKATFADVSKLLDLPNGRCIYTKRSRPNTDPERRPATRQPSG